MTSEEPKSQKKIQCWISLSTWNKIEALGYTSPTLAVTKAFELLLQDPSKNTSGSIENPELKVRIEKKDKKIAEKDRHIDTLKGELEGLRNMHTNYMLQMQTLINPIRKQLKPQEQKSHGDDFGNPGYNYNIE
jgi:hypothetical protein